VHYIEAYLVKAMASTDSAVQEPMTYNDAKQGQESIQWMQAVKEELDTLFKAGSYELVDLPQGHKALGVKWVFKLKFRADGTPEHYKARLVVNQGYAQVFGRGHFDTYAPVLCYESLRLLLGLAVLLDLDIHQMDIDSAFLQANLEEQVFVHQPEGFVSLEHPYKVWKLIKGLYGLKQAPLAWNKVIDGYLRDNGFISLEADPCVCWDEEKLAAIGLYVDDCIIITHPDLLERTKKVLSSSFPTKDLKETTSVLGIEIIWDRQAGTLELRQSGHIGALLKRKNMVDCKPVLTPMVPGLQLNLLDTTTPNCHMYPYREVVGSLLYISCATSWDIAYAVAYLSKFMKEWDETHWHAAKHLLHYLKGTRGYTIQL